MASVTVSAQNTRPTGADAEPTISTKWGDIGGGAGGAAETDFVYQGTQCFARKGTTGQRGIVFDDSDAATTAANTEDLSTATGTYQTVMFKVICISPGLLESSGSGLVGQRMEIGSGSADYYYWDLADGYSNTYPIDKSWKVVAIDPNVTAHGRTTTGTPNLTGVDWYAYEYDQTAASKGINQGMDAVDIGAGLTLTGGDSTNTDGVWQDFSDADWGTSTARYGYVRESEGTYLILGMMIIGNATATVFQDTGSVVIFVDSLFAAGFSGITVGLSNATNDIDFTNNIFLGRGDTATSQDTRPTFTVSGTTGSCTATGSTFDAFSFLTLTSATTFSECIIKNSGVITASGTNMSGTSVSDSTVATDAAALVWDVNTDPNGLLDDMSFTKGSGTTHAIEFGTSSPTSMTLTNVTFSGYNASNGQNDSTLLISRTTGTVNITISGGTTPSYKTAGATVNIITGVISLTVNGVAAGDKVSMFRLTAGGDVDKSIYTSHASSNTSGNTQFIVQETIATDTPATGIVRAVDFSTGTEQRYAYSSFDTSTFSLDAVTLDRDYNGSDTAYVPFIDTEATGTSVSVSVSYSTTRDVVTVVRNKGILPFSVTGQITNANFTATAIRTFDSIVD